MRHFWTAILLLSTISGMSLAQSDAFVQTGIAPTDVPADARSVAMGESFVALPGSPAALMYNPAGLAACKGISAGYAQRRLDHFGWLNYYRYNVWSATVETPWATLGLLYDRNTKGDLGIFTISSPAGVGSIALYEDLFAIGAGKSLGEHWDVGLAVKMHTSGNSSTSGPITMSATPAFLADAGVLYKLSGTIESIQTAHAFTAGVSVQNAGSSLKVKETVDAIEITSTMRDPIYLRLGVTYRLTPELAEMGSLTPLDVLVTTEYRRLLNPMEDSQGDFWGYGVEATFYELLSARFGGYVQPYQSIFGETRRPALRYGVGLHIPVYRIDAAIPLTASVEYAAIPLNMNLNWGYYSIGPLARTTLQTVSIMLHYEI